MNKQELCVRLLRSNWKLYLGLVPLQLCAIAVAPLALASLMRSFFEGLVVDRPESRELALLVVLMLALALFRMGVFLAAAWLQVATEYMALAGIWRSVLENFLRGYGAQTPQFSAGEVLNRLRDDAMSPAKALSGSAQCTAASVGATAAIVVMVAIAPAVAAAAVLPMAISTGVAVLVKARLQRTVQAQREASARVTSLLADALSGIESIQCANAEPRVAREFAKRNLERATAIVRDRTLLAATSAVATAGRILGMSGMLFVGTQQMRDGTFSVGDFAFCAHMLGFIALGCESVADFLTSYGQLDVPTKRLHELIAMGGGGGMLGVAPPSPRVRSDLRRFGAERPKASPARLRVLSAVDLTFKFANASGAAIQGVSFDLTPGTLTLVLGAAGSGKSTLLRCMVGHLPLHEGRLLWNGESVEDPRDLFQPPACAACAQSPHVFAGSVRANIELGLRLSEDEIEDAVRASVLDQDISTGQLDLATRVGNRGRQLSGGQLHRLGAARMFARSADLYVLDDVTRSLDPATELAFWERLSRRLERGAACLAVSHSQTALQRANRIIVMVEGKVAAQGPLAELASLHPHLMREVTRSPD